MVGFAYLRHIHYLLQNGQVLQYGHPYLYACKEEVPCMSLLFPDPRGGSVRLLCHSKPTWHSSASTSTGTYR